MTEKTKISTADKFCERLKRRETVSRFDVDIAFRWDAEASAKIRKTLANLTGANLTGANLTGADLIWANLRDANLTGAKGAFTFNFGVKLKVVEE